MGSSPIYSTIHGESSNGRTRGFDPLSVGSNPTSPSNYIYIYGPLIQLAEIAALEAVQSGFESRGDYHSMIQWQSVYAVGCNPSYRG
jgi:hypothetical protein